MCAIKFAFSQSKTALSKDSLDAVAQMLKHAGFINAVVSSRNEFYSIHFVDKDKLCMWQFRPGFFEDGSERELIVSVKFGAKEYNMAVNKVQEYFSNADNVQHVRSTLYLTDTKNNEDSVNQLCFLFLQQMQMVDDPHINFPSNHSTFYIPRGCINHVPGLLELWQFMPMQGIWMVMCVKSNHQKYEQVMDYVDVNRRLLLKKDDDDGMDETCGTCGKLLRSHSL